MSLNPIFEDSPRIFLNYHISTNFSNLQFLLLIHSHFNRFFKYFLFNHLQNYIPFHYCLRKPDFLNCLHLSFIYQLNFYRMLLPNLLIKLLINLIQTILNYNPSVFTLYFDFLYTTNLIKNIKIKYLRKVLIS